MILTALWCEPYLCYLICILFYFNLFDLKNCRCSRLFSRTVNKRSFGKISVKILPVPIAASVGRPKQKPSRPPTKHTKTLGVLRLGLLGRARTCYHPRFIYKTSAERGIHRFWITNFDFHITNQVLPAISLDTGMSHLELGHFQLVREWVDLEPLSSWLTFTTRS